MQNCAMSCIAILAMANATFGQTKELAVDLGTGVKLELVLIPAGEFAMGDGNGYALEKPVHKVTITKPFYLGKYEVTQEQWLAVMGAKRPDSRGDKFPVGGVAWNDCQDFLTKLNAKTGEQGGKFVLPTEAQWEYACRAGSTTKYCFGDDEAQLADYGWYNPNAAGQTHPVGEKKPNGWGLYDMHGNIWEWCADWSDFGYYAKSPLEDPRGPATGTERVLRGGAVDRGVWVCRSAFRSYGMQGNWPFQGFRVARVLAE